MSKAIPPAIRRKIIKFDPFDGHGLSITAFCEQLKISRRTFYNIRARYDEEAGGALHPHSSAPITPARTYDEHVTTALLAIRKRLKGQGWDYGPISIRFEGIASGELTDPVPSVSTIARLLRAAGAVESNPKKRPTITRVRFQRGQAMHMWQIDGFYYRLHDDKRTPVTIYQIIDDATRFDVGTCAYAAHENSTDATDAVRKAIATFGAPHELLSDNGAAFNQLRNGVVGPLETYLASVGCVSISGRPRNPQTQGKDERSHRTLFRFLEAHKPKTLKQCGVLIEEYRDQYNNRRPHQGLPECVTPATAWHLVGAVPPKDPIPLEVLKQKAESYVLQRRNAYLTSGLIRQDEKPPRPKRNGGVTGYSRPSVVDTDDNSFDTVTVTEANQMVFFQGMRIAVPRSMRNRRFHRTVTESELAFWDAEDGELVLSIPLPVVAIAKTKAYINSYNIKGVWMKDPPKQWRLKRENAQKRFATISPDELLH